MVLSPVNLLRGSLQGARSTLAPNHRINHFSAQELSGMASIARPLSIPLPNGARLQLVSSLPFILIHVAALSIFFFPFKWYYALTCFLAYEVRMFFVTAGYHRYFSHRSFKTSRWFQFVIAWMAMSSSQKGIL